MSGELFAFTPTTVIVQRSLHRPPKAKLTIFPDTAIAIGKFLLTLLPEAEEETGSAEEQPASNRFPRHTEIVFRGVVGKGCAHYFRRRPWLRKPKPGLWPRPACPMDCASSVSGRLFPYGLHRESCSLCSCVDVPYCRTGLYASSRPCIFSIVGIFIL